MGYYFLDIESLVLNPSAVSVHEDLDIKIHGPQADSIIDGHSTARGVLTNEDRELLIVRKDLRF